MNNNMNVNEFYIKGRLGRSGKNARGMSYLTIHMDNQHDDNFRIIAEGKMDPRLMMGDYIEATGYIVGYHNYDRENKRSEYTQYFVANEIKRAETDLHKRFGHYGGFATDSAVRIYLSGKVAYAHRKGDTGFGRIGLEIENGPGKRPYVLQLSVFVNSRWSQPFQYYKGDEICVVASASQRTKRLDGKMVRFENINVNDIVVTKKAEREEPRKARQEKKEAEAPLMEDPVKTEEKVQPKLQEAEIDPVPVELTPDGESINTDVPEVAAAEEPTIAPLMDDEPSIDATAPTESGYVPDEPEAELL